MHAVNNILSVRGAPLFAYTSRVTLNATETKKNDQERHTLIPRTAAGCLLVPDLA